jgi:hypothetical protein
MKNLVNVFTGLLVLLSVQPLVGQTVRVEIDASKEIRRLNPLLFGINTARWDESLFPEPFDEMLVTADRDAIEKVKASGITLLKYPGGNDADAYTWNAADNSASEMDTDEYIAFCRATGAVPFITINFNASPELAAAWVHYCNNERGYNVKYWEVGDEQWGTWAKGHAPPEEYAKKYIIFVKAMKAVDPTIKVATNVPLGSHPENWTERVLKAAGPYIDLLTFTFFPQKWGEENDDTLFASVPTFRSLVLQLRSDVERVLGKQGADSILYVNVGYNSVNHSPGPQTLQVVNALWTADMLGVMAETGVDIGCYWALHNYYPPRKGDYGYLSSEGSNTPRYPYYVFQMMKGRFSGTVIQSKCSDPALAVHASKSEKKVSAFLLNKDKKKKRSIVLELRGFKGSSSASVWLLDKRNKNSRLSDITGKKGNYSLVIPSYSMIAIDIIGADSVVPPPNLARMAECSASSYSTIGPKFKPSSAVDGKLYTKWNSAAWTKSNGNESQWFQLTWKKSQRFDRMRIHWGVTYATDYTVLVSADGKRWKPVLQIKEGKGGVEQLDVPRADARAVRIEGKRGSKGISAYSIREIEVYYSAD